MKKDFRVILFTCLMVLATSFVFVTMSPVYADCPQDILSYWTLDETSPGSYADSVNGNHGLGNANPTSIDPAKVNGGQLFDGNTTGIDVADSASLDWAADVSLSFEFWMNRVSGDFPSAEVVVGRDATDEPSDLQWWTGVFNTTGAATNPGSATISMDGTLLQGTANLADGQWHHVVAIRDANLQQLRLYVDGALDTSADITTGSLAASAELNIGYLNRKEDPGRHRFNGTLDEIAIYERVLTPQEISDHFNTELSYCDIVRLTVKTDGGTGTGTVNPAGGVFEEGRDVQLTAVPDAGSTFVSWSGDLSGNANPETITMDADKTVTATFEPDADADGVSDDEEDGAPNGGDGNNDFSPDKDQENVASLETHDDQSYVTLISPENSRLTLCSATIPPSGGPDGITFPWGFFSFEVNDLDSILGYAPGDVVPVSLILHNGDSPTTYYKFGPTPADATDHWYEFLFNGQTGAEFSSNTVTLNFVDGERGDDDLVQNNIVVDQGGPGSPTATASSGGGGGGGGGGCFIATAAN